MEVLESADKVFFVSNFLLTTARKLGYKSDNYIVINNGYPPDIFKFDNKKESKYPIIGFCGNLNNVKNVVSLAGIFEIIKIKFPEAKMQIIGQGTKFRHISEDFKNRGLSEFVSFTGGIRQKEIAGYFSSMSVLLLPSFREGFPTVVAEAIGSGLQVVGSDIGGVREAVGDCGKLVDHGDDFERRFAKAAIELIQRPVNKQIIRKRADELTWKNIIDKEVEVYHEILGHG